MPKNCPIIVNGQKALAKLYVAETLENDHKFYLVKIEKASSDKGFILNNEESTPNGNPASADATISISEIFNFVKNHDKKFEKSSNHPVYFNPKAVSEYVLNANGTPMILYQQMG